MADLLGSDAPQSKVDLIDKKAEKIGLIDQPDQY
jgi:hypothetical protein